jgi:hypothetical protein
MPGFRAYIVGPDGHFVDVREFVAPDRGEATRVALGYVDGHPVELWEGDDWIGTFKPSYRGGDPIFKRPRMPQRQGKPTED